MKEFDGAVFLRPSHYRYARKSLWYGYIEPVVSFLFFAGLAMIGAAVLGAMFVFGAAGGLKLVGNLMGL